MAIASVGTLGTGVSSTSGTSFTLVTATNALASGDFATLTVTTANDTNNTGVGQSNAHTKISGGTGFWIKLWEYNYSAGVAGDGVTESLWVFLSTGTNAIGTTFTISVGTAVVDKVVTGWKFTKGAGTAIRLVKGAVSPIAANAQAAANGYGSVAFAGMASGSRLYIRALGKKANTTTAITPSTSFTVITGTRSRNNAAAVFGTGEFRINTSTGETSNPTQAVSGPTAGVFAALEEYTPSPAALVSVDVGTATCFKNAACTTAVSADGDEVLGVKDGVTGLILSTATAGTGPLYRPNSSKPYLECSTSRFFDSYTGGAVHVGDNVGEYMMGAAVRFDDIDAGSAISGGVGLLTLSSSVRPASAIRGASGFASAWAYSQNGANFDAGPALTVSVDCVISEIVSQAGFEVFLNGSGNGASGLDTVPFSGGSFVNIGNGPFVSLMRGRIYGFRVYQGQDSTTHTAMVTALTALLPSGSVASASGTGSATAVPIVSAASSGSGTATGVGKSIALATGSATGSGSVSAIGTAAVVVVASASGTASVSATGQSNASGLGSASGLSSAAAVGASSALSAGSSSGTGAATGVGRSQASGDGASTGTGTAQATPIVSGTASGNGSAAGVGAAITRATAASSGLGSATATGQSQALGAGSAAGIGAAAAIGSAASSAVGASTASGTALGVGSPLARGAGSSAGTGSAAAVPLTGASIATATGTGTANGVGSAMASTQGVASGSATVLGSGNAVASGQAASSGLGSASGSGSSLARASGASAGDGEASANGASLAISAAQAAASGAANANGSGMSTGTGSAAGDSSTLAEGSAFATGVALSAGFGVVVGQGQSIAVADGFASAIGDAAAIGSSVIIVANIPDSRTSHSGRRPDPTAAESAAIGTETAAFSRTTYAPKRAA